MRVSYSLGMHPYNTQDKTANMTAKPQSEFGYIITGLGRSGTTVLTHLFHNAGYNTGDINPENIGTGPAEGGGLEYAPFTLANMRLQKYVMQEGKREILRKNGENATLEYYKDDMHQSWPDVMKDPRYLDTHQLWHHAGFVPKHVFICLREAGARNKSVATLFDRAGKGEREHIRMSQDTFYCYYSVFRLIVYCEQNDIPYTSVLYPRVWKDRAYAEKILEPFIENVWDKIQHTWDETLVHHTTENPTM
jgi:hypothetical protein